MGNWAARDTSTEVHHRISEVRQRNQSQHRGRHLAGAHGCFSKLGGVL